jgi:hypothetical protein
MAAGTGTRVIRIRSAPALRNPRAAALITGLSLLGLIRPARADDFIVYSPYVTAAQTEVELRGFRVTDGRQDLGGTSAAELSVAHSFTGWWKAEVYLAEYLQVPGTPSGFQGYEFENTFQLTPAGEYWADLGFLASYERNTTAGTPDAVEFGPLIEKTLGRFAHTVNLIWEKEVGSGAGGRYEFRYSYSSTYAVSQAFRPGLEAYGRPADRAYQLGPIVAGEFYLPGTTSDIEYRLGVVFGLNPAAPRQTWLAQLEYEFL